MPTRLANPTCYRPQLMRGFGFRTTASQEAFLESVNDAAGSKRERPAAAPARAKASATSHRQG